MKTKASAKAFAKEVRESHGWPEASISDEQCCECARSDWLAWDRAWTAAITCKEAEPVALLQAGQEPVAIVDHGTLRWHIPTPTYSVPVHLLQGKHWLYTEPPAKPVPQPLSEKLIDGARDAPDCPAGVLVLSVDDVVWLARAVEAGHGISQAAVN